MNKKSLLNKIVNENGSFGIKEIAITVGVIIVIGFALTQIESNMGGWITDLWDFFMEKINELF